MSLDYKFDSEINYIWVSITLKNSEDGRITGLFHSIRPMHEYSKYETDREKLSIWLYVSSTIGAYSLEHYNIRTISIGYNNGNNHDCSQATLFNNDDERQESAKGQLIALRHRFEENKKLSEDGFIDMKEYKNIPTFLDKEQISSDYKLKSSSISNNTTNTPNTVNTPVVNTHVYSTANQISYVTNNKESTTMITRTTKYSAKKAIEQMKKKIDDIKNGVYKNPKLKALEVDSSKNHPDNDDDDDDDDYIIGQY
jgi:hypothetical protein